MSYINALKTWHVKDKCIKNFLGLVSIWNLAYFSTKALSTMDFFQTIPSMFILCACVWIIMVDKHIKTSIKMYFMCSLMFPKRWHKPILSMHVLLLKLLYEIHSMLSVLVIECLLLSMHMHTTWKNTVYILKGLWCTQPLVKDHLTPN